MAKPVLKRDPLSPKARDVISLFSESLAEVRFPDVDLKSLEMAADELRALQLEAERIEEELEEARARVLAQSELLNVHADRGLAYARVFAATDAKLMQRVAEVMTESAFGPAQAGPKKKARARKSQEDASLFAEVREEGPELAAVG